MECKKGFEMVQGLECIEGEWIYQTPICKPTEAKDCGSKPLDVIFVVDQSASVGPDNFSKMINSIVEFTSSSLVVDPTTVNVGFIAVAFRSIDVIHLLNDQNDVLKEIGLFEMDQGSSVTFKDSFNEAIYDFNENGRSEVPNVMILLAGGKSTDNPQPNANVAKESGVDIFTIGIGQSVDKAELREMASVPSKARFVDTFDEIGEALDDLLNDLC
ncbi:hypothetical protein LOTGIDRAFT_174153 [Lottia gigantea]|uniref:VWFA domain-containing protein n=1 Tax=Lottia gigantea TaxID=225164 RepID=V4AN27_LOTGI|nr:hypothetical protein LOTGIDRAFT_174153 [Lottia gigantea]ESO98557.1 hypothetical protein LOTGIDRAFT_174153 [Lottia gigantea]